MVARGVRDFHVSQRLPADARGHSSRHGLALGIALALVTAAPAPAAVGAELLAGAAVSLREPLRAIARDFEARHPDTRVQSSFGASSTLAMQARAGAPLDVFVSADPLLVDALEREGWSEARSPVASNALVVVAASGFPLQRASDLVGAKLRRLALPAAAVPLGRYARQWLAQQGLLEPLHDRILQTEHARATLAAVDAGYADAAIVYVTDARATGARHEQLAIAPADQPSIRYVAALRRGAGESAGEFFRFVSGAAARRHFAAAGFGAP